MSESSKAGSLSDDQLNEWIITFNREIVAKALRDEERVDLLIESEFILKDSIILDEALFSGIKLPETSRSCFKMMIQHIFHKNLTRTDYSQVLLTAVQKLNKSNPELDSTFLGDGTYKIILKIGNSPLLELRIVTKKTYVKPAAALITLKKIFPMIYKWMVIANGPFGGELLRFFPKEAPPLYDSNCPSTAESDPVTSLYASVEQDFKLESVNLKVQKQSLHFEKGEYEIFQKYYQHFKDKKFSASAAQIHQKYVKKSLKLYLSISRGNIYSVKLTSDNEVLFIFTTVASHKFIAKNLGGLKYFELYLPDVFENIIKAVNGEIHEGSIINEGSILSVSGISTVETLNDSQCKKAEQDIGLNSSFTEPYSITRTKCDKPSYSIDSTAAEGKTKQHQIFHSFDDFSLDWRLFNMFTADEFGYYVLDPLKAEGEQPYSVFTGNSEILDLDKLVRRITECLRSPLEIAKEMKDLFMRHYHCLPELKISEISEETGAIKLKITLNSLTSHLDDDSITHSYEGFHNLQSTILRMTILSRLNFDCIHSFPYFDILRTVDKDTASAIYKRVQCEYRSKKECYQFSWSPSMGTFSTGSEIYTIDKDARMSTSESTAFVKAKEPSKVNASDGNLIRISQEQQYIEMGLVLMKKNKAKDKLNHIMKNCDIIGITLYYSKQVIMNLAISKEELKKLNRNWYGLDTTKENLLPALVKTVAKLGKCENIKFINGRDGYNELHIDKKIGLAVLIERTSETSFSNEDIAVLALIRLINKEMNKIIMKNISM